MAWPLVAAAISSCVAFQLSWLESFNSSRLVLNRAIPAAARARHAASLPCAPPKITVLLPRGSC
jgi:hypothetical protein